MGADFLVELNRTRPDYVVYVPGRLAGVANDTGNEHFLVFDGPDGSLMAVWTQSSAEGFGDHRIVFSRSSDEGVTWAPPLHIAGPRHKGDGYPASWAFPLVSKSGRLYVLYHQKCTADDDFMPAQPNSCFTGRMDGIYSDDQGRTWSAPRSVPMPRSPYDNPDPAVPPNWIVWQKPQRDRAGQYFTGYTRWISQAVRRSVVGSEPASSSWTSLESVVEFMRFENIDDDPEPDHIRLVFSAWGDQALRVPHYIDPLVSVAQEPSLVRLPDQRLFCTMRTMAGCIWYSLSSDDGRTWCNPRPLLRKDHGRPIPEPLCCCPIYRLSDGRYALFHHNNDGRYDGNPKERSDRNRRPSFIALGEFRPHADQPIWFSDSIVLMDNDGVGIGGPYTRLDLGVYSSFTGRQGNDILWHCDRKFFLVGKRIDARVLAGLDVPRLAPAEPTGGLTP